MRNLFSIALMISTAMVLNAQDVFASPAAENVQRAADEKVQMLLGEIQRLKNPVKVMDANSQPETHTCVANCTVRYSDGRCGSYDKDFCGPNAKCAAHCTVRYSDGRCGSYDKDFCGKDATCTPNCVVRYSDGRCGSYDPDVCY